MTFRFDADELLRDELVLSKMDVATRQLNAAIRMLFFGADVVALHTVTAAAHEVLRNLASHEGIVKSVKDSPLIAESKRAEFIRAVNLPQNFFKHAEKDPKGKIAFRYNGSFLFILDAVLLFVTLGQELTYEMKVFLVWIQLRFPDLLCFNMVEKDLAKIRDTTHDATAFKLLARVLLKEHDENVA
ncbi:MAG TPA: hypothetical protein PK999_18030 [Nitrospira sp.]|nr:hypothetical protein [Nitrospira sp.]